MDFFDGIEILALKKSIDLPFDSLIERLNSGNIER
jgi:hypothetical protein